MEDKEDFQTEGDVLVEDEVELQEPKRFKVIILNDDYTSMDFVVSVLETIFSKSPAEATSIMLAVHKQGRGVCGIYSKQIAETKLRQVEDRAREESFPLRCVIEEA